MIIGLAWRNLWRQPIRTGLSFISITLASALLVFMLSFQLGIYDTMRSNTLRVFDGFAQIQPPDYNEDPDLKKTISSAVSLAKQTLAVNGVSASSLRASSYVILANGELGYGAAVVGVNPDNEKQVSSLAASITSGRYLRKEDHDAIIMGDVLARNLKLSVGDRVTLLGSALDGTVAADNLQLIGLFHTGISTLDRQFTEIPLPQFQSTFVMGNQANIVVLSGAKLSSINQALPKLQQLASSQGLVVKNWAQLQPELKQAIQLDFSTSMLWYSSLVVVVVFIILNTLLMSIMERTREFGMLMAIGMRATLVGKMLWLELFFLTLIGSLSGILIGGGIAFWFSQTGISVEALEGLMALWGLPGKLYPTLSMTSALAGPMIILVAVSLGGLIQVRRVGRLDPVNAMRAV